MEREVSADIEIMGCKLGGVVDIFQIPKRGANANIYTNAVEGFHRMLRKFTKTKTVYPTDDAVRKSVYMSIQEISKKWSMPIRDWGIIIGQLMIFFEDRLQGRIAS